jgi:hypothetical protein
VRAAEILGCDVYDCDGIRLGQVHDLRFTRGPSDIAGREWYRLTGFECGSAPFGHRLGYGRSSMTGPAPFLLIFRFLARRSIIVDWKDVVSFTRPRIEIGKSKHDLKRRMDATQ